MKINRNELAKLLLEVFKRSEEYIDGKHITSVCLDGNWDFKQIAMDLAEAKERWIKK